MYHKIEEQEEHPEDYRLADISRNYLEDDCHDLLSKPRQTQTTVGLFLERKKGVKDGGEESSGRYRHRPDPDHADPHLEKLLMENKGFWIDKPTLVAPLINKLKESYSVEIPRKDPKKSQGIFYRPDYLELDHLIRLGKAGLLYPEEEMTDSEEEVKPDDTMCIPLRKKKYRICDPCKPERKKVEPRREPSTGSELVLPFKKIPTGCQCDWFGEHNVPQKVWDNPFRNEVDMIRMHEMDKYLKPFKSQLLNDNFEKNPPVFFKPVAKEAKRTYPELMLSNL